MIQLSENIAYVGSLSILSLSLSSSGRDYLFKIHETQSLLNLVKRVSDDTRFKKTKVNIAKLLLETFHCTLASSRGKSGF